MYPVNRNISEIWVIIPSSIHVAGLLKDEMPRRKREVRRQGSKGLRKAKFEV